MADLWFMTLSASLLILLTLLLRGLLQRAIPRGAFMVLWLAAALRLLIPVRTAAPVSFFNLFPGTDIPVQTGMVQPADSAAGAAPALDVCLWIWAAGAAAMAFVLVGFHIRETYRCRFKVRDFEAEQLTPRFVRVWRCKAVSAPCVTGLQHPQILLPNDLTAEDLHPVLAHELAHIRGWDILKKYVLAAALCVNWFNPLVWVMIRFASRDLELLCDKRALSGAGAPSPVTYARALLNAEERRTLLTLGFKSDTEVRIMHILKKEEKNRLVILLSALLVTLLITACTTTRAAEIPKNKEAATETSASMAEAQAAETAEQEAEAEQEFSDPESTSAEQETELPEEIVFGEAEMEITMEDAESQAAEIDEGSMEFAEETEGETEGETEIPYSEECEGEAEIPAEEME